MTCEKRKRKHVEAISAVDEADLTLKHENEERLCRQLSSNTTVRKLTLRFGDSARRQFLQDMLYHNTTIDRLTVYGRLWGSELYQVLSGLRHNRAVHTLDIRNFEITTMEVKAVVDLISHQNHRSSSLQHLRLQSVEFPYYSESSMLPICEAIAKTKTTLRSLDLDAGTTHNDLDVRSFSGLLRLQRLTIRNLDDLGQRPTSRASLASVRETVANNPTLQELSLTRCGLSGCQLLDALLGGLSNGNSIRHLDLSNNKLDCIDAIRIATFVEGCSSLRVLKLCNNHIGNHGWNAIVAAVQRNPRLTALDLSSNRITNVGPVLQTVLEKNSCLTTLDLSKNPLGNEGVKSIAIALDSSRTSLRHLALRLVGVGSEGILAFCHALHVRNRTLQSLSFGTHLMSDASPIWTKQTIQTFLHMLHNNTELREISDIKTWPSPPKEQAEHCLILNRAGRKHYLPGQLEPGVWPYVLVHATVRGGLTALYNVLQEKPLLMKQ